jgi:hypothetical protein
MIIKTATVLPEDKRQLLEGNICLGSCLGCGKSHRPSAMTSGKSTEFHTRQLPKSATSATIPITSLQVVHVEIQCEGGKRFANSVSVLGLLEP